MDSGKSINAKKTNVAKIVAYLMATFIDSLTLE